MCGGEPVILSLREKRLFVGAYEHGNCRQYSTCVSEMGNFVIVSLIRLVVRLSSDNVAMMFPTFCEANVLGCPISGDYVVDPLVVVAEYRRTSIRHRNRSSVELPGIAVCRDIANHGRRSYFP